MPAITGDEIVVTIPRCVRSREMYRATAIVNKLEARELIAPNPKLLMILDLSEF